jgi:threonine dehydrogenase-like Zn-dependent dehydrogenase
MSRLVYHLEEPNEITPREIPDPERLTDGWVLGEFVSGTICSTDVTNVAGRLGHGIDSTEPKIIGHECCFRVLDSKSPKVQRGDLLVLLGSDWYGFAERENFFPILASTDDDEYKRLTKFTPRGYFDPKDDRVKAACIVKKWRRGVSLIEPITHVYTALLHTGAFDAQSIVVLGAGFCGQIAGLLSKQFGVRKVSLVDVNEHRLRVAITNGCADLTMLPSDLATIAQDTKGTFADVLFDALPGTTDKPVALRETRDLGAQLVRPGGTWVMYSASEYMDMPSLRLLAKGISIRGAGYDSRLIGFPKRAAQMNTVLGLIEADIIPVHKFIDDRIDFFNENAVKDAFRSYGLTNKLKIELQSNISSDPSA